MDFTKSSSYEVHTDTGYRYHEENKAIPTAVSGSDLNALNWELMSLVKGMGIAPKAFNKDDQASYTTVLQAIKKMAWDSPSATESPWLKRTDRFQSMPLNSDFNTFVDQSVIYNPGDANHLNAPFGGASGILMVFNPRKVLGSTGGIAQIYINYEGYVCHRALRADSWSTWRESVVGQDLAKWLVYAGTSNANLDYPIGTSLLVVDSAFATRPRNAQTAIIYTSSANTYQYTTSTGGSALTGTWACRGGTSAASIFQRVL